MIVDLTDIQRTILIRRWVEHKEATENLKKMYEVLNDLVLAIGGEGAILELGMEGLVLKTLEVDASSDVD